MMRFNECGNHFSRIQLVRLGRKFTRYLRIGCVWVKKLVGWGSKIFTTLIWQYLASRDEGFYHILTPSFHDSSKLNAFLVGLLTC